MKIKKIYHDLRIGQSVIFPVLAMVNFVIISYSLTPIADVIPIYLYMPLVIISVIMLLIVVGNQFRHKQQPTDFTLAYEKNIPFVRFALVMLKSQPITPETLEMIKYHEDILSNKLLTY